MHCDVSLKATPAEPKFKREEAPKLEASTSLQLMLDSSIMAEPSSTKIDPYEKPWYAYLTIDLLFAVARRTFIHPFIAWMVPLGFRAQAMSYHNPLMRSAILYASILTIVWALSYIDGRIAGGRAREVDLREEGIVITGGERGLGLLIAQIYVLRGANVAVMGIGDMPEDLAEQVTFCKCDVGDRQQVEKAYGEITESFGSPPTILINNAAVMYGSSMIDASFEEVEKTFQTNVLSHFYTIKTFLPGMLSEERGTIVTISSVLGYLGCKNLSHYTSSKAAITAMHNSLLAELPAEPRINLVLCTPGQLSTPLFANVRTPSNFFGPVVPPKDLALAIVKAVDEGRDAEITMPLYTRWIGWMNVVPAGLRKVLRWASGMDSAMDGMGRPAVPKEKKAL